MSCGLDKESSFTNCDGAVQRCINADTVKNGVDLRLLVMGVRAAHAAGTFRPGIRSSQGTIYQKGPTVLEPNQAEQILGQPIHAAGQVEVGTVNQVYLHDTTGKPAWATVHTGVPGTKATFIPLAEATIDDGRLTVPYGTKTIAAAPRVEASGGRLTLPEVATLNRHYGLRDDRTLPSGSPPTNQPVVDDNRMTGDSPAEMTRSEERLKVATTTRATQKVRMRKHVVVEQRTVTVTVQREEILIEHEPLDDDRDNQALEAGSGPGGTGGSTVKHEMVLHEEQIFIEKRIVPVERVRLVVETVTTQQQVSEQLRKEQIDTDFPSA